MGMTLKTIILVPETPKKMKEDDDQKPKLPKLETASKYFYKDVKGDKANSRVISAGAISTGSNISSVDSPIFAADRSKLNIAAIRKESPFITKSVTRTIQISSDEESEPETNPKMARSEPKPIEIVEIDEESDNEPYREEIDEFELKTIEFLNTSDSQTLQDSLKTTPEQTKHLIASRKYSNYNDLSKLDQQTQRQISKYVEIAKEFDRVDSIIDHCDMVGKEIQKVISKWEKIYLDNDNDQELEYPCLTTQPNFINHEFTLKQYQLTGISWMLMLYDKEIGGILADEMGLGIFWFNR
jgi:SNF2 family DNA or RNA helicase